MAEEELVLSRLWVQRGLMHLNMLSMTNLGWCFAVTVRDWNCCYDKLGNCTWCTKMLMIN